MSIVSQISPSIYFATLTTIYLVLSFITIGSKSLAYAITVLPCTNCNKFSTEEWIRKALYMIVFICYINGVITAYGSSPFTTTIKIFENDTHYTISSHMPSIIACTITLFKYLIHLWSRNITWLTDVSFWEVQDDTTLVTKSNMELQYTKVQDNESRSYKGSSTTVDATTGGTFTVRKLNVWDLKNDTKMDSISFNAKKLGGRRRRRTWFSRSYFQRVVCDRSTDRISWRNGKSGTCTWY
jgi:hypothetical protein